MEIPTGDRCQSCGEPRMVMDALLGIYACDACGHMGDQAVAELGSEFQLGHVIERRGTNVSEHDISGTAAKGLMCGRLAHNFYTGFSSWSEGLKLETIKKVQHITALLRVPGDRIERVKQLLELTMEEDWGLGKRVHVLVAACVYIRQSQLPLTIPELADCVTCDAMDIGRMYNRVIQKLCISVVDYYLAASRRLVNIFGAGSSTLPALSVSETIPKPFSHRAGPVKVLICGGLIFVRNHRNRVKTKTNKVAETK